MARIALIVLLALILSACTQSTPITNAPTTVPTVAATAAPTIAPTVALPTVAATAAPTVAVPTQVPTVAAPTTAATVAPTIAPTVAVPPTVTIPIEVDAPGPGWVFALTGDANQDGVADAVFYWPADTGPDVQFEQPERAAVAVAAHEVVIVQRSAAGLETLLRIDRDGAWADQPLFDFAGRRSPAGYLLALDPARGPLVNLLPYGAGGISYEQIGIIWEAGASAFRITAEHL